MTAAKTGYTAPAPVNATVTVDLTAPTAPSYSPPATLKVGVALTDMSPTGGTGVSRYTATGLPPGLVIGSTSGVISGTPSAADAATAAVTVTAADTAGNPATVALTFPAVAKGDQDLSGFKYAPASLNYGATTPVLTAPTVLDSAALTYTSSTTDVCTVDDGTGVLSLLAVGACTVKAATEATDNYNAAEAPFDITVNPAGALTLVVDDVAGDNTVNITEKADGFSISGHTGSEAGVAVTVKLGTETFTAVTSSSLDPAIWSVDVPPDATYITGTGVALSVAAAKTGYTSPTPATRAVTVDLTAPTAPSYSPPATLKVGVALTDMSPTGGTGVSRYTATGLPPGLVIGSTSGVISGTPSAADAATAAVTVTAADTAGNPATVALTFPAVAKGDQDLSGFKYAPASLNYGATTPVLTAPTVLDSAALTYTSSTTDVCTVDDGTGVLSLLAVGACTVKAATEATDNYNAAEAPFDITVNPAGALTLVVDDVAGDNTVNITEKADGFSISGHTGSEAGVAVTVKLGTETFTAVTSSSLDPAIWSVDVPPDATYITGTGVALSVAAAKTGYTSPTPATRAVTVDLTAPTAPSYSAPATLKVGVALTDMSPTGGTGVSRYTASGLPPGLVIGSTSGVISGTPSAADAATAAVTVTAADTAGNPATVALTFPAVAKGDQDLSGFKYAPASLNYGATTPVLTAPTVLDSAALTYTSSTTDVCTVDDGTGVLSLLAVGACTVKAATEATDNYNAAEAPFDITVNPAGALTLVVDDVAGDNTVNITEKADGFSISGHTGSEAGVAVTVKLGTETFTAVTSSSLDPAIWSVDVPPDATYITGTGVALSVAAAKTGYTSPTPVAATVTVDLTAPTAPSYTAPGSLKVGVALTAVEPSGGTGISRYTASGLPPGLVIGSTSGVISGTPSAADAATAAVTVTAADTGGNPDTVAITFPVVAKGDQDLSGFKYAPATLNYGAATPALTAPTVLDSAALTYASSTTDVCTVDAGTGVLSLQAVGACTVKAATEATDNYNAAEDSFDITVNPAGALTLVVDDVAGDNTVNIAEKADGFSISGHTGSEAGVAVTVILGTETFTAVTSSSLDPATWSVDVPGGANYVTGSALVLTVAATKTGHNSPSPATRTLTVDLSGPTAPSYTAPASLTVGTAITAANPTGGTDISSYTAAGLPAGLSIDGASGAITGTPTTAAATAAVTVTAADAAANPATVDLTFPAVAAEQIEVMIDGNLFRITILYKPNNARVTVNTLSVERMNAQLPPDNVVFSTPSLNIEVSGIPVGEHVHFCLPRGNVPDGFTATIYTAQANDGTLASHWYEASNQEDELEMSMVCAKVSSFSLFRVGYLTDVTPVRAIALAVRVSPASFAALGDIITYTYTLTNDGTETLVGVASIDDEVVTEVTCEAAPGGGLESGDSLRCTGEYMVTQADVDAQRVVSGATAMLGGVSSRMITTTALSETANNQLPRLSVSGARAAENVGLLTFIVRLSVAATEVVTVNYATEAGTARRNFDFSHVSGTLRFDPGESEKQVKVTLRDDDLYEQDETFTLRLSDPVNAVLGQATATGTIIDDDGMPTLYIRHATAAEGAGELVFKVVLEPTGSLPVTVRWATLDGTAQGNADYQPSGGTLTFNPGEGMKKLRVPVIDDAIDENTEILRVTLSNPVNALLGRATGTGYIYDDDVRGIRVMPQTVQVDEGTTARFEVVLATQPVGNVTLELTTDAAGSRLTPNQLHFDATNWSRPQTVAVAVPADEDMDDADRMLMLTASGGDYVAMRVRVVLSISDTDSPPDNLPDEDRIVVPVGIPGAFNGVTE